MGSGPISQQPAVPPVEPRIGGKTSLLKDPRVVAAGLSTAAVLAIAVLTAVINSALSSAQRQADHFSLIANRATATNTLRAEVFGVLSEHLAPKLSKDFEKVVLLAGLHGNFSKFIDTRPVFAAFLYEIEDPRARRELKRLAQRVARRQADYLVAHGAQRIAIGLDWRRGEPSSDSSERHLFGHRIELNVLDVSTRVNENGRETLEDVGNTVKVSLIVDGLPRRFTVSYLDVPYMDNVFLVEDGGATVHRIALLLIGMTAEPSGEYHIRFEALHFPDHAIMPSDVPSPQDVQNAIGTKFKKKQNPENDHSH